MKKIFLVFTVIAMTIGCKSHRTITSSTQVAKEESKNLKELVAIMQGFYSSEAHSKRDTTYFNIALRMTPIWKNKGHYLFVEQAMFSKPEKPYRVRVYKVSQRNKNEFISEIYTLKNEKEWIGKWTNPEAYDALSESDIDLKSGCEVVLHRDGFQKFIGSTGEKTCPSELRGASYASSKVNVYKDKIVSWDQGYDKVGKQVWGAEKGGYEFIKVK